MTIEGGQFGKFIVHESWFDRDRWKKLLPVMNKFFIVRAEFIYERMGIEYTAFSEDYFEDVKDGNGAPEYSLEVKLDAMNNLIEFRVERYDPTKVYELTERGLEWRPLRYRY